MATLNNNQIASIVNAAMAQSTGSAVVGTLDLQGIIDTGNDENILGTTESFTKALINVIIKNWFADTSYRSSFNDPFYEDQEAFGAIMQFISVEVPEVQQSHAWTDYTSGTTTVGQYTVYLPVVTSQLYGHSVSWALPISITDNQWNTAFHSATELAGFVSYIWLCVDNALLVHMEDMSAMNRNNFMAEKIHYQSADGATGCHAINLVQEYVSKYGLTAEGCTVEEFRTSPKALLFASEQLNLYTEYVQKMSTRFNTSHKKRFTPKERLIVEVLSDFEADLKTVALSSTYHKDIVELPGHRSIPAWQGLVDDLEDNTIDFDAVSEINVEIGSDGTAVNQSGIVALIVDKWAIVHTFIDTYLASQRFDINRLTMYEYQYTDRYINNLTMNGIVFYLADVAAVSE